MNTRWMLILFVQVSIVCGNTPAWKHTVIFPNDPLERRETMSGTNLGWIKCTLNLIQEQGDSLYFQDSQTYDLHYDFVTKHLEPFVGIAPEEFNRISLYAEDQQLALGAIVTPPQGYPLNQPIGEYGIQLVRRDPYTREETASLFQQIKAAVQAAGDVTAYYMPTLDQKEVAHDNEAWLAEQGIPIGSPDRWIHGNVIYSRGWALGRCTYVPGNEIEAAYLEGRLLPGDILLTDAVPAEIPVLAGIISLSASTPNSHVAILANTYAIPFVYLAEDADAARAQSLVGHPMVLRATPTYSWDTDIRLIDANEVLSDEQVVELLALKEPPELIIQPIEPTGTFSISADALLPENINRVGGKAAHFGLLRRAIPDHSPVAVAFTFDLWLDFLGQTLDSGLTLRTEIDRRLQGFAYPPRDMAELSYQLAAIRALIKDDDETRFSVVAQQAVLDTLQDPLYGFDPEHKIRFRSSTNMEDSENFTGAGLYDSYSGCLADDLDDDQEGPSHCDPNKDSERGVFRAIRKVFASFYNHNAFVERLRHSVDEQEVGMALLVHHSYPDEIEWANGVATYEQGNYSKVISLVSQAGAVSVANPEPGVLPEQVTVIFSDSNRLYPSVHQYSNLVPLGQTVMTWSADYEDLARLLKQAADEYGGITGKQEALLDFEYKKVAPDGKLIIKQIRPLPRQSGNAQWSTFLISEPVNLHTFQGEFGNVMANHHLKSDWLLTCRSLWVDANSLAETFYTDLDLTYQDRGTPYHLRGQVAELTDAEHDLSDFNSRGYYTTEDRWRFNDLPIPRTWILRTERIAGTVPVTDCPIITLQDLAFVLECHYDQAVVGLDYQLPACDLGRIQEETIRLELPPVADSRKTRIITDAAVTIVTEFAWPPHPTGPTAGYTAPLARWYQTTLSGLTTEPIVLTHPFAQTYQPGHHNFWEDFLFEPRLDPNVPLNLLAELDDLGITQIHAFRSQDDRRICLYNSP
ncbi:PEP/pyruvate-binding domain-containing protein [Planctomycetota bacterium]